MPKAIFISRRINLPPRPDARFLEELNAIYGAEKYQETILPLLKNAASSLKLRSVLAGHLYETLEHGTRLGKVFGQLGQSLKGLRTETLPGIVREMEHVIGSTPPGTATRDAGLIAAARQLEHFEISAYSSLAQLARRLEYDEIADSLETTLNEEKDADDLLMSLAENYIYPEMPHITSSSR